MERGALIVEVVQDAVESKRNSYNSCSFHSTASKEQEETVSRIEKHPLNEQGCGVLVNFVTELCVNPQRFLPPVIALAWLKGLHICPFFTLTLKLSVV